MHSLGATRPTVSRGLPENASAGGRWPRTFIIGHTRCTTTITIATEVE